MIISIDAEKAFDKIQHPFMIKALMILGIEGMNLNIIKTICQTYSQHHTKWGETESISSKVWNEKECPLSPHIFNRVLEFLARAIGQEEVK
jgi:hypothetical protein